MNVSTVPGHWVLDLTNNLRLTRHEPQWRCPDTCSELIPVLSAERATGHCPLESALSRHQRFALDLPASSNGDIFILGTVILQDTAIQ